MTNTDTAESIVKDLAEWAQRYPRSRTYPAGNFQVKMDGELIDLENRAIKYMNQVPSTEEIFNAVIDYVCDSGEDGLSFLRCWREGDWNAIRKEWPEFDLTGHCDD